MRASMRLKLLAAAWLAALGGAAFAQDVRVAPNWENPTDALPHPRDVAIGIPREAGSQRLIELADFNNSGGLDNIAQYRSADGEVFATIYIYRTTLADIGIAVIATDYVIRHAYGSQTRLDEDRMMSVGGLTNTARIMVYEDAFDGQRTSLAAFLRAGQWTVKVRVTGPQSRRDEVVSDATALLSGLSFGDDVSPEPARAYRISNCPSRDAAAPARLVETEELRSTAISPAGMFVGMRITAPAGEGLVRPAERGFCVMAVRQFGQHAYLVAIRPEGSDGGPRFVLIGDAGRGFEVIGPPERELTNYVVALHGLGQAPMFGPFGTHPPADQFFDLVLGGADWLGEPPLIVSASDDGDLQMELPGEDAE